MCEKPELTIVAFLFAVLFVRRRLRVLCFLHPGENFGKYLKVGVVEDEDVKDELAGLCRFFSKNHGEDFVSFAEYISDMKVRAKWNQSANTRS